jgi:asparagine synthase (glutamine-hydrolysing)
LDESELHPLTTALAHRGPDGRGHWVAGSAGLGHTRLAIIDPAGGAQPMTSADGRVAITYNGELYNFRELRAELERAGHRFVTRSDTEVVLHAWIEWQERCVERFRGMFAFGIVDQGRRCVFLARDHFGIKPLVWFADGKRLCFASELQALRRVRDFPAGIDLLALDRYLALSYVPAPLTAFERVKKLPPAHYLLAHLDGRVDRPVRYWELELRPADRASHADWVHDLEGVLRDSVRAHLVADVPFGAFLSGGVDSSLVVSLMAEEMGAPVETFSIGFADGGDDELTYAAAVRDRWGTQHHERVVTADALALLPELVAHYGEPFGDSSAVPVYRLAQLARERVPMVLSGDGGDEAFAGYPRYHRPPVGPLAALLPRVLLDWIGRRSSWHWDAMIVMRPPLRRSLWKPEFVRRIEEDPDGDPMAAAWARVRGLPRVRRAQLLDYVGYLPGSILTKVDIAAMSHGLEVRTPLVDRNVVDFAATIPTELLVGNHGAASGKRILKDVLARWFPQPFVERPKQGFGAPLGTWLAGSRERRELERTLLGAGAPVAELLEPAAIRTLLSNLDRGGAAEPVWLLLFLARWLETLS